MKNIELLPLTDVEKNKLNETRNQLAKYASIYIDVLEFNNDTAKIRIEQKAAATGYILTQKELLERGKELFTNCKFKIQFIPLTFNPDFADIDSNWVSEKMKEFSIKPRDLSKQLGIDKSTLSILLNGRRNLTKSQQAAFYYYFLTFELNRDFRKQINQSANKESINIITNSAGTKTSNYLFEKFIHLVLNNQHNQLDFLKDKSNNQDLLEQYLSGLVFEIINKGEPVPGIVSEQEGKVSIGDTKFGNREITVTSKKGIRIDYLVPLHYEIVVHDGDWIKSGTFLNEISKAETDLLAIKQNMLVPKVLIEDEAK